MDDYDTSVFIYNGADEVPMDVTHVRVDPSVTVIPENAFQKRRELEVVELPEGLIEIGDWAFDYCKSLKRIRIPSTVEEIGNRAFQRTELEVVNLPEGLQSLGNYAFYWCPSLWSISIPSGIRIKWGTFLHCHSLSSVTLSDVTMEIEKNAFCYCTSLVSINLPSSLKVICAEAFQCCQLLNEIHMHDAIESIGTGAFKGCNITSFRIPPLVTTFHMGIVGDNTSLVSLELAENVSGINGQAVLALRNITLPSEYEIYADADISDLLEAFPEVTREGRPSLEELQQRFDDLPIHKLCYYQSYNNMALDQLNNSTEIKISQRRSKINPTGKQQDCLGMTPLHILACSTKQHIQVYRLLIDKYPETLIMKDKWGGIPLMYAFWCNTPPEVLDLLVESYKSLYPDYEFDWKGMLLTLTKRYVPPTNIQRLITTQQHSFPDQEYDMQSVVIELAALYNRAIFGRSTSIEVFSYLLRVSIAERLDALGITKWRTDLKNSISAIPEDCVEGRDRDTRAVYDRLETYESIKEGTSMLELALWKMKIDDSGNKRAKVGEDISYKEQCRINCGADIIMRNVLPYLLPSEMVTDSNDSHHSDNSSDESGDNSSTS